ncbi:MAG TPA: ATP-binding protein [Methanoregulaceae archaeon]|nr:ATP-binding protein [Methanoregulaceae archaeon]HQJ87984.1 ATP-binding protein [Methanoregulaceae archaeon]
MAPDVFERGVPAAIDELPGLLDAFEGWLVEHAVPPEPRDDLLLALDEAFSNAVVHGYAGAPGEVAVRARACPGGVELEVVDRAPAFDPFAEAPLPDLDAPLEERPIGGLGVFLIRELMDRAEYRREQDRNVLILSRRWSTG